MPLHILATIPRVELGRPSVGQQAEFVGSFTVLRLAIRPLFPPGEPIAFTMTSARPQAGKSLVAGNLALSFAEAGFRTLLVDGDVNGGAINRMFGVPASPGLTDYAERRSDVDACVYPTPYPRLNVLPRGSTIPSPNLALAMLARSPLLATLRAQFDVVIVDAPALGADALAVTVMTTDVVLMMGDRPADRVRAEEAIAGTLAPGCRVLGGVINRGAT